MQDTTRYTTSTSLHAAILSAAVTAWDKAENPDVPYGHITFRHTSGSIKLLNTKERLQQFASQMMRTKSTWALWGGGPMPAELAKPRKAKPTTTWHTTSLNVCVQCFEDEQFSDGLAMALGKLGAVAYWHQDNPKNEPFLMLAPQPVEGMPARLVSGRHAIGGEWVVFDTVSGYSIKGYKAARSRAAAERAAIDVWKEKTPAQIDAALNRVTANDTTKALARLCELWKVEDAAEALADAQAKAEAMAADAEAQALAVDAVAEAACMAEACADAVAELAPVAPVADKTDLATLALIATGRCGGSKETQYRKAGLLKTARDGWTDITEKGERLLLANGYALGLKGWALIAPTAPATTPAEAVAALVADAVAAVAIDAAQATARGVELATVADVASTGQDVATPAADAQAVADACTEADADTCTADAVADATEAQASTATPGHTTAPRAMASTAGAQPGTPGSTGTTRTTGTAGAQPGHSGGRGQLVAGKSGRWVATFHTTAAGLPGMLYTGPDGVASAHEFDTGSARMAALQRLARAADATPPAAPGQATEAQAQPDTTTADASPHTKAAATPHTPPPSAAASQETPPVCAAGAPDYTHPVETLAGDYTYPVETLQQSSSVDATTPSQPRHPRNIVPRGGLHIVEDAFEAWTFHHEKSDRFGFVMYLGKQSKPYAYYGYATEAKRDAGFERHAQQARDILASKAKRKAEDRAKLDAGHGLQVGDVVRSSWGYDQTNVDHYQIIKVIGKRTVEVRALAVHEESTGDMSGRVAPVWGEFVGEVMRRQVDKHGNVNMLSASYGRASKIEPVAVVHGVRCYAATHYSSYA